MEDRAGANFTGWIMDRGTCSERFLACHFLVPFQLVSQQVLPSLSELLINEPIALILGLMMKASSGP